MSAVPAALSGALVSAARAEQGGASLQRSPPEMVPLARLCWAHAAGGPVGQDATPHLRSQTLEGWQGLAHGTRRGHTPRRRPQKCFLQPDAAPSLQTTVMGCSDQQIVTWKAEPSLDPNPREGAVSHALQDHRPAVSAPPKISLDKASLPHHFGSPFCIFSDKSNPPTIQKLCELEKRRGKITDHPYLSHNHYSFRDFCVIPFMYVFYKAAALLCL